MRQNHPEEGFFSIPLHRLFSFYFTRLIMKNYLLHKESMDNKRSSEIFRYIFGNFVDVPQTSNKNDYL
jgi:dipeptide/tripeptide permease